MQKAKETAAAEARKAQEQADREKIDAARAEAQSAGERAEAAEKQARLNATGEGTRLGILFDDLQEKMQGILDTLKQMEEGGDAEAAGKFRKALQGALAAMLEELQGAAE